MLLDLWYTETGRASFILLVVPEVALGSSLPPIILLLLLISTIPQDYN